ncbi:MAG TPA: M1 family aminopeptidase [Terriglobales bacterium]|nr:M1 family aminopeptidase [Terriglobales bacterium]
MNLRAASSLALAVFCFHLTLHSQATPAPGPNSDPTYRQLRDLALGTESVTVNSLELKRDAATFHLHSGIVCFVAPVNGKVTGAVFVGNGNLVLDPPIPIERSSLKLLSKQDEFVEQYNHLVLRFTDSTYEEIKKSGTPATGGCDPGLLRDSQHAMRHEQTLKYNLEARILQDVLSTEPGGLFLAFIHGDKYNGKEIFVVDPHGAPTLLMPVAPEEVELLTYDENKLGVWTAFHNSSEYKKGTASGAEQNGVIRIEHQQLDTRIERNAHLSGKATVTFAAQVNGLRVVPFDLYRTLRVENVVDDKQQALSFIQEDKNDDADFSVVLPRPLPRGEKYTLTTTYSGKDVVINEGGGNYYPTAREDWYPNSVGGGLGNYALYDMTFRIPKGMKMAATGQMVSDKNEGGENITVWKSAVPLAVAGFNFGHFKSEEAKMTDFLIEAYANEEPPDEVKSLLRAANGDLPGSPHYAVALGNMSTTPMLKKALAEAELSMQLYSDYFGPIPYKQLSVSQQTACNYGQSWPGLVYLPMCYFYDTTIREQLGMEFDSKGYWKVVAPHEVAHQWWGHEVGFNSYRDQWMSEGFADASASIYLQMIEKNPKKFIEFWNDERTMLLERNKEGFRAIDAGPVTMGYRMSNDRTGFDITRRLIYPKGAYILHMIRMMMWDRKTGDQNFKDLMHDFAKTYAGQSATTEDFKAMVEKHMTQEMQAVSNGNMDWFFNEYVYGTALPTYKVDYSNVEKSADGTPVLSFKISQSGVGDSFRMLVPIYLELEDGRSVFLGRGKITGNSSIEAKVPLRGLKEIPKRAVVNRNDDVLAAAN